MNGENPNTQNNEFNGGVLGGVQAAPTPVEPVAPVMPAAPATVEPVAPVMPAAPATVEPVAPAMPAAPAPVEPVAPVMPAAPAPVEPVAPVMPAAPAPVVPVAPVMPAAPAPVEPVAPVMPTAPAGPTAQPIPGTEGLLATPNKGNNTIMSQTATFMNQQKPAEIGTNPPANETKEKKPMNKIIFIVIIVVLIAGVAFGVYYFLKTGKKKLELNPKTVQIISDMDVPTNLSFYASVVSGDASICRVDVTGINTHKVGDYQAIITCGEQTYTSKVSIIDNIPPVVLTNILFKPVNGVVDVNEFINTYIENGESQCSSMFVNEDDVKDKLQNPGGPYEIDIESSDEYGNKTNTKGILYVTEINTYVYTMCSSNKESVTIDNYQVSKNVEDVFTIGNNAQSGVNYVFLNAGRRVYHFEFGSSSDYKAAIGDKKDTITFNDITGHAGYDDETNTLTISTDLSKSELDAENNGNFSIAFNDIKALYETQKGYKCANVAYSTTIIK